MKDQTQLFHWLRGFVELTPGLPTTAQWEHIRMEIMNTTERPMFPTYPARPSGDCGCKDKKE